MTNVGKVFLIGAGPGDPGLFTLKGQWVLEQADVVLYDYLSHPTLLRIYVMTKQYVFVLESEKGRIQKRN